MNTLRLAFSPDSDDIFMFWPLLHGKVDTEGLSFEWARADTETLNGWAERDEVDVLALSVIRASTVSDRYALLPHGASVGRGYGPVVVASTAMDPAALGGKRIGIPGLRTTSFLTLRFLVPDFEPVVVPIAPYERIFEALERGEVDAALLIHEGRLLYPERGLHKVLDLGEAWAELTGGLPLPLGGNAIRRGLGPQRVAQVSRLVETSIEWAMAHREEVMDALLEEDRREGLKLSRNALRHYLDLYANDDTRRMKEDVRVAIQELVRRGRAAGFLPENATINFAE